ncbi:MAG: S8 family peptidase [Sphingobium sp.]|nr:S8 family serine peptidase [Sphingobium sp.]MCP5398018.1 S8 family serine peptidase [Sphingomonas sp.]
MVKAYRAAASVLSVSMMVMLSACGGGGGGVSSTPAPSPTPSPSPSPSPTPTPTPTNYDTTEYANSTGPNYHGAITAYQNDASGAGVTVGVIDTGIDVDSPEFTGRISSASTAFNSTGSIQDTDGHGTAVTSVIAAARNNQNTLGMAWEATVMALRTDDPTDCDTDGCSHPTTYIRQAIDHAVANGAQVINISLGGDAPPSSLIAAVDRATAAGVIIVISSGNDSAASPDAFARAFTDASISRGLVLIATSNNSGGVHSDFANGALGYETVTLSTIGERVRAPDHEGTQFLWSGTSFAAPQVAGAIALMLEAFPGMTPQEVVQRLLTTATDAGASGPDALFGMGIMDIAAAFAPAGTTTLGDSKTALSLANNGTLSPAMGDASGSAGPQAVTIDALGRAYRVDLKRTLTTGKVRTILTPLGDAPLRSASLQQGGLSGAFSFVNRAPHYDRFGEQADMAQPGRFSGQLQFAFGPKTRMSAGYGLVGHDLANGLASSALNAPGHFLAAQDAGSSLGFQPSPDYALGIGHDIGEGSTLTLIAESGTLDLDERLTSERQDSAYRYQQVSARIRHMSGPVSLSLGASLLREKDTLLGARLAQFFAVEGGQSLFADAHADIALSSRWTLGLAARHGWTSATSGEAHIRTLAWSADIARSGLINGQDRFGLRLSQPLRVTSGGVDALLPIAHDYTTGQSQWAMQRINLAPMGREIDAEISYGPPVAGGWLSLNSYWRRQPGHIAWANDDMGGAVRFTLGY